MIHLHSLGQCLITVGASRLLPNAKLMFASALYVALEGSRTIARDAMATLFWPELEPEHATHSLRQVLYRLRAQGMPLNSDGDRVLLPGGLVRTDYDALLAPAANLPPDQLLARIPGGFLPGYTPTISQPFAHWVESHRERVNAALRRQLVSGISALRAAGDWPATGALAQRCLELDPLNEEATLAYAESLAMDGSKARAIMIIDRYMNEIGPGTEELHAPALALKKRVAALYPLPPVIERDPPQIGREEEMAKLDAALNEARQGRGSAYLISGPPGMGKTRLVTEFTRAAQLKGIPTLKSQMGRHDDHRPMGAWTDLVPQLQRMPGALGCDPESLPYLRRLTTYDATQTSPSPEAQDAEYLFARIRLAVLDLVGAVASESCLILLVEDVHWMDEWSWDVVCGLTKRLEKTGMMVLLTRRDGDEDSTAVARDAILRLMPLEPLRQEGCLKLLGATASTARLADAAFSEWCVRTCAGNPYFLIELGRRADRKEGSFTAPTSLTTLVAQRFLDVAPLSQRVLQAAAVLGKNATVPRIERVLDERRVSLLDGLDELGRRGLILADGERVLCRHDLLGMSALTNISEFTLRSLHRHAAEVLESELGENCDPSQLWDCALHREHALEHDRAFQLLIRCVDRATETGAAAQAVRVLDFALERARKDGDRGVIEERLVAALHSSNQFGRIVEIVRQRPPASKSRVPKIAHSASELYELEAILLFSGPNTELSERTLRCVTDQEAPGDHRVAAGLIGLQSAHLAYDRRAARRIRKWIEPVLGQASLLEATRFRMIYEGTFGDVSEASRHAQDIVREVRASGVSGPSRARYLRSCALAFSMEGHSAAAESCCEEVLSLGCALELPALVWMATDMLAHQAMQRGDLDAADRFLETLPTAANLRGQRHASTVRQRARIAIWRGDYERARNLLGPFSTIWEDGFLVHSLFTAEVRALLLIKADGWIPTATDMARMLRFHRHGRRFNGHDTYVLMLVEALEARGERSAIGPLIQDFARNYRREHSPLHNQLCAALERLSIPQADLLSRGT